MTKPNSDFKAMPKVELKWKRILRALLNGTLNRFDAQAYGDTCLNSTVSELGGDHLVCIDWAWEEVPCLGGRDTARVKRYWVARTVANIDRARGLLGEPNMTNI